MAGSQDPNDNPVAINVVPMVDVIFCLCVFFMCSMKFKEMEGKFESWLPKDKGTTPSQNQQPIEEIRVAIFWDEKTSQPIRMFGRATIRDNDHLESLLRSSYEDRVKLGHPETPCIIDAAEQVHWKDVVTVVNLAKRVGVDKIEFAAGKNYEAPGQPPAKK